MNVYDNALMAAGVAEEILLLGIVSVRRVARNVPTFTAYLYWLILSDVGMFVALRSRLTWYTRLYEIELFCDGLILFVVLFDLARSVLRPLPAVGSRTIMLLLFLLMGGAGGVLWWTSDFWSIHEWSPEWHTIFRTGLTFSLLRIVFLLMLGWFIQLLNRRFIPIGWGERELQIATGIGCYALVSLAGSVLDTYHWSPIVTLRIAECVSTSFALVLIYWIICFSRPVRVFVPVVDPGEQNPEPGPRTLWKDESRLTSPSIRA